MEDPRCTCTADSPPREAGGELEASLVADLTHQLLPVLRDWALPVAGWVRAQGGDPRAVVVAIVETLHALADGLDEPGAGEIGGPDPTRP